MRASWQAVTSGCIDRRNRERQSMTSAAFEINYNVRGMDWTECIKDEFELEKAVLDAVSKCELQRLVALLPHVKRPTALDAAIARAAEEGHMNAHRKLSDRDNELWNAVATAVKAMR